MQERTAIWLIRSEAEEIGLRLCRALPADLHAPDREGQGNGSGACDDVSSTAPGRMSSEGRSASRLSLFREKFFTYQSWVMVMAAGIAVRYLDGLPKNKMSDPGVVVLDEGCHFAISLLGGHEGGANALAHKVATITGAVPVITTATEALKPLCLGIGCRRDVSLSQIEAAVSMALGQRNLAEVRQVATAELKGDEPALQQFCHKYAIPLRLFSIESLAARSWVSKPSEWVRQAIGVDGVCEPCALMSSNRGRLIVKKTVLNGVSVAIVEDAWG